MAQTSDSLELRVARLESCVHRWRRAAGCLAAVVVLVPLCAFMQDSKPTVQDTVKARMFEVVDRAGTPHGRFGFDENGTTAIWFDDAAGRNRVRLALQSTRNGLEPVLRLCDETGTVRLSLASDSNGQPHVLLSDNGGKPRIHAAVSNRGSPSLVMIHEDGQMPSGLGIHPDGRPWLLPSGSATAEPDKPKKD